MKSKKSINLFRHQEFVKSKVLQYACTFNLKIYCLSVQKDHIHCVLKFNQRQQYTQFIRSFSGVLARYFGKNMWRYLPFTRVLNWGKDFKGGVAYLKQNESETWGLTPYQPRKFIYKKWLKPPLTKL